MKAKLHFQKSFPGESKEKEKKKNEITTTSFLSKSAMRHVEPSRSLSYKKQGQAYNAEVSPIQLYQSYLL